MSQTKSQTERQTGYPFMTEVVDGELVTGILFIPSTGKFYEALPEGHEDVDPDTGLTLKDPRSGDTFDYRYGPERYLQMAVGDHCCGTIDVERWLEFRETYISADETNIERANELLDKAVFGYQDGEER